MRMLSFSIDTNWNWSVKRVFFFLFFFENFYLEFSIWTLFNTFSELLDPKPDPYLALNTDHAHTSIVLHESTEIESDVQVLL